MEKEQIEDAEPEIEDTEMSEIEAQAAAVLNSTSTMARRPT